jgi:hypothetical protein
VVSTIIAHFVGGSKITNFLIWCTF